MSSNLTAPTIFVSFTAARLLRSLCLGAAMMAVASLLAGCGSSAEDPAVSMQAGDYATSLSRSRELASAGNVEAQNLLGVHYHLGLGVERSPKRAAEWFERAAIGGSADARRNLGTLYQLGEGMPADRLKAYAWYFAADRLGHPKARDYLISMANELTPNQIRQAKTWVHDYLREQDSPTPLSLPPSELERE